MKEESKNVQTTPTRTYCKRNRPLPYYNQNCRTPRHWKFTQDHLFSDVLAPHYNRLNETVLMMDHKIRFCGEIWLIIPKLLRWSGGTMVLGKHPVLGRPTNLDYSSARAYCAYSTCGWEWFGHFFLSSIISLYFLPHSGRRPDID